MFPSLLPGPLQTSLRAICQRCHLPVGWAPPGSWGGQGAAPGREWGWQYRGRVDAQAGMSPRLCLRPLVVQDGAGCGKGRVTPGWRSPGRLNDSHPWLSKSSAPRSHVGPLTTGLPSRRCLSGELFSGALCLCSWSASLPFQQPGWV